MFINWAQKEIHLKLVYCGPPLSGKTTNLEMIHQRLPSNRRSDLVSVKTRQDRTLFFDFMQLDLNEINGFKPKFKLYTVPGQSYYEATRRLVMKDVDGWVFVADSSAQRLTANRRALVDVWQQLKSLGYDPRHIPFVLQCNKQDLSDAVEPTLLARYLALPSAQNFPAVATDNVGTSETLKAIIKKVVTNIHKSTTSAVAT